MIVLLVMWLIVACAIIGWGLYSPHMSSKLTADFLMVGWFWFGVVAALVICGGHLWSSYLAK